MRFLTNPEKDILISGSGKRKLKLFMPIFLLEIMCILVSSVLIYLFARDLASQNKLMRTSSFVPVWFSVVSIVFIIPIIEEGIFRFPLKLSERKVLPYILFICACLILIVFINIKTRPFALPICSFLAILLIFYFLNKESFNSLVLSAWKNHFAWIFFIFAACFGIAHISNYQLSTRVFLFFPLLILPQLIMGVLCGYVRLYLGFFWGYALHALHNLIIFLPVLIVTIFLVDGNHTIKIIEKTEPTPVSLKKHDFYSKDSIRLTDIKVQEIFARFGPVSSNYIEFTDKNIANKLLDIKFSRSENDFRRKRTAGYIVLQEIIKKYKLVVESKTCYRKIYKIRVTDQQKLELHRYDHLKNQFSINNDNKVIITYGTIKILALEFRLQYDLDITDISRDQNTYWFRIPKLQFSEAADFMEKNYGIRFEKDSVEVRGCTVGTLRSKYGIFQ